MRIRSLRNAVFFSNPIHVGWIQPIVVRNKSSIHINETEGIAVIFAFVVLLRVVTLCSGMGINRLRVFSLYAR